MNRDDEEESNMSTINTVEVSITDARPGDYIEAVYTGDTAARLFSGMAWVNEFGQLRVGRATVRYSNERVPTNIHITKITREVPPHPDRAGNPVLGDGGGGAERDRGADSSTDHPGRQQDERPVNRFHEVTRILSSRHRVSVTERPGGWSWDCSCGKSGELGGAYPTEAQATARGERHLRAERRRIENRECGQAGIGPACAARP